MRCSDPNPYEHGQMLPQKTKHRVCAYAYLQTNFNDNELGLASSERSKPKVPSQALRVL